MIFGVYCVILLSMAALSLTSTGTAHDRCRAQGNDKGSHCFIMNFCTVRTLSSACAAYFTFILAHNLDSTVSNHG
jgi:hypothetical protein